MRGEEDLKSAQRRPKRHRRRMSEDEDINFDVSDTIRIIKIRMSWLN